MYLIVGLGNPGPKYQGTRHNIGFQTIERWCQKLDVQLFSGSFQSRSAHIIFQNKEMMVLCPLTFMNLSGNAVSACVDFFGIQLDNILVIHDDLDLPVGRLKITNSSGSGGHRGIQSIIDCLGDKGFPRLKIGIGRPQYSEVVEDYVLAPPYPEDRDMIEKVLCLAMEACEYFVENGIVHAMNRINCRNLMVP